MKKLFLILLVLCTALALIACNGDGGDGGEPTDDGFASSVSQSVSGSMSGSESNSLSASQSASAGNSGEPAPATTPLVKDGVFQYEIVYRTNDDKPTAEALKSYIETTFGVTVPKVASDFSYKTNAAKAQILIGATRYEASQNALYNTRYKEWTVHVDGPKIVVFGHDANNLGKAITALKGQLAAKATGTGASCSIAMVERETSKNYSYNYESILFGGVELRSYRIIYTSGFEAQAEAWQTWIANQYGYLLEIGQDTKVADNESYEILIGRTNRPESVEAYAQYKPLDRAFFFSGKKAIIVADNTESANEIRMGFNSTTSVSKVLAANLNDQTLASSVPVETKIEGTMRQTTAAAYPRLESADLRLMTFNVKSQIHSWDTSNYALPVFERAPLLRHMLMVTNPDVIGFQEITGAGPTSASAGSWNYEIKNIIADLGYDMVMLRQTEGSTGNDLCYNPIAYKRDKYTVLKTGFMAYDAHNGNAAGERVIRNCAWALLQDKATGEAFILVNSHWSFVAAGTPVEVQNAQSTQEAELITQLAAAFPGVPIFATADYNSGINSQAQKNLREGAGMVRLDYPENNKSNTSIDQIYALDGTGVSCVGYMYINQNEFKNNNTYYLSDHHAVYADISLGAQAEDILPEELPDFKYTKSTEASSSDEPQGDSSEPASSSTSDSSANESEPAQESTTTTPAGGGGEPLE